MIDRDELGDPGSAVVADQRHPAQIQPGEQVGDQAGDTRQAQVGVGIEGHAVRAEWQVGCDAAEARGQPVDDRVPQLSVHQVPVEQDDGLPRSGLPVTDGPLRQRDLRHVARSFH
jgi:hypothetical protein